MAESTRLPNGRWKIRYRDPEGHPRSKTCNTRREALAFVQEVGHRGRQKTWVPPERGRITLAAWCEQSMSTVVHLRPTTIALYERELVHIHTPLVLRDERPDSYSMTFGTPNSDRHRRRAPWSWPSLGRSRWEWQHFGLLTEPLESGAVQQSG